MRPTVRAASFRSAALPAGDRLQVNSHLRAERDELNMAEAKPSDCIYCASAVGSAEHTILAALGGLRTDRGILCTPCNNRFGAVIDKALAEDMKPINAVLGVMNGRTRAPIAATVEDAATGRNYVITAGRRIEHPEVVVVSESMQAGIRQLNAVASTQKQVDDLLHRLRQDAGPVTVMGRETVPLLFASPPTAMWSFGGTDTFRAIARLAVNILATFRPALARGSWLVPLKNYMCKGGDDGPWVSYAYSDASEIPGRFDFAHRFVLVLDAESGEVRAHVSLLGIIELSVRLGAVSMEKTETIVYEMDVLAQSPPDDIAVTISDGFNFTFPSGPTPDPSMFVPKRLARVLAKRKDRIWSQDAPSLLAAINAAREVDPADRHESIVDALAGQQQRLLNLVSFFATSVRRHLVQTYGEDAGSPMGDAFGVLAAPDGSSRTGVTELTYVHADMLRYVMADHLLAVLNERAIEMDELRLLLEGVRGAEIVGRFMVEQVNRAYSAIDGEVGDG